VGTGFSGAVLARKIADELNLHVNVVEKRPHIGGNMYDTTDKNGILVQRYGPHILCTNHYSVIEYLSKYSEFYKYTVKLLSYIDGNYVRLPFNFETLQQLVGAKRSESLIAKLRKEYQGRNRVPVLEIINNADEEISAYGYLLFEKAYKPYCAKQWDIPIETIDKTVLDRVPMAMSYDERYMDKDFQYLPTLGFTKLFENLLNHKNIQLSLNDDALNHIAFEEESHHILYDNKIVDCLVFTGPIDELFDQKYGVLPYRSLDIAYEHFDQKSALPAAIVSFPQALKHTRKTEYRKMMFDDSSVQGTLVATEYPVSYKIGSGTTPYYPVLTAESSAVYSKYLEKVKKYKTIFLCGRLAEFKYYNMDDCILHAFDIFDDIKHKVLGE
jgi:UDP-galactopyranose mutase